ncbi:DEAD/DEAH box helicase family protein [Emticicia sp. TH156]|uniref:DEAD/DEAH box helicase family protein n=1 Tax=Emticicia sp. TH156 TaxID=2067454 RepID=UPI000C75F692|nr:DEAD/DEAH box helicase family protein [Emticicia sp. TH156]PLK42122.1 restriction endonuclease [Emticicia sp. TH156]
MTQSNFSFLTDEWAYIYENAQKAESYVYTEPTVAAILCRKALEEILTWLYDHDADLELPNKDQFNLNDLIWEKSFQQTWGKEFGRELSFIKKIGNDAAHASMQLRSEEVMASVKYLFRFSHTVVRTFSSSREVKAFRLFDESFIPRSGNTLLAKEVEKIKQEAAEKHIELQRREAELSEKEEELAKVRAQLTHYEQLSNNNGIVPAPAVLSEAETRKLYIDVMLRETGWKVDAPNMQEFITMAIDEATGVKAKLKIDYVLWGNDGKPLGIVEAKRTSVAVERGRSQAKNYADALQEVYGQRPIIFYTNGYDTYLWDDTQYAPRKVYGFLNQEELQRLMIRKTQRKKLSEQKVNQAIANRYYQERAIRRVAERFETENQRKALLVMATGTGKTRVSAAIVDLLTKAQWAKRILFLADRNALVTQAFKNYNEYLPNLTGIDLTKTVDEGSARVVFSTYQTILNRIDEDYRENKRYYGVGHFDLIIIDEAHRSIYDKYGAIFEYFDAFYLGLTATPKNETDRDTYALFNHAQGEPTDAYEYTTAVADNYLVPIKKVKLSLKFPMQGIRYNSLSEEEKREWERKFYDPATGEIIDEIDSGAINQWLFNRDTVDKVWQSLMEHGHKVAGNEKLGKTIIFARNHKHAEFIHKRFYDLYPHYKKGEVKDFAKIIDNYDKNAEGSILEFKIKDRYPQIAISVDMLDTGIDVPEIVNLVFFKPVYSAAKFWQMLGRGTRLCKDLFGPDDDKKDFYVFDVCNVFDFFDMNPQGVIPGKAKSLSESLFNTRVEMLYLLHTQTNTLPESEDFELAKSLVQMLQQQVASLASLEKRGFEVTLHLRQVEYYGNLGNWSSIKASQVSELAEHVAPLVHDEETHEQIKRFDLLMAKLQLAILRSEGTQANYIEKLQTIASELLRKTDTVPTIARKKETLRSVLQTEFWAEISISGLEKVRLEIRELNKLLEQSTGKEVFYTNFQDELTAPIVTEHFIGDYGNFESHYAKLRRIIHDNANHLTIHKLHTNQPISSFELDELDRLLFEQCGFETHEKFKEVLGDKPLGVFIRSILGLDKDSARSAFSEFLSNGPLSSQQIEFINQLITLFSQNGTVEPDMLFEQPFKKYHESGVAGIFPDHANRLLTIIEETNRRANVG